MMRSKGRRRSKKPIALQLTSLLDMFTIILLFLLVSFQAEDQEFVLHAGMKLPASSAKSPFKAGVNLAITKGNIVVEGKKVYQLQPDGTLPQNILEAGKIEPLVASINDAWKLHQREENAEDIALIQADKELPYRTIHVVMRSAAFAGVYRFRLVVEKE